MMIKKITNLIIAISLLSVLISSVAVKADEGIRITESSAEVAFPYKLVFKIEAESDVNIKDIRLHYQVDRDHFAVVTSEIIIEFIPDTEVATGWTWDMIKSGGLPTGTNIEYWWTVTDADNERIETEKYSIQFNDERYKWHSLIEGDITIYWYQGNDDFARQLMVVAQEALIRLAMDTGAHLQRPVRLYIYASAQDLQGAMIFPQEWTGGVAYTTYGTVAIGINAGNMEWGKRTIVHELTHLVTQQVTFNPYNSLPVWLNEGLSMYAEGEMEPLFINHLRQATENDELISVCSLASPFSADARLSYLSYAQSMSIVEFLIDNYGQEKMLELLNIFEKGSSYDGALMTVYGFDMDGLNDRLRDYITAVYRLVMGDEPETAQTTVLFILAATSMLVLGLIIRNGNGDGDDEKSFTIHDLPVSERPRERLQKYGAESLSAQEILALILGRGIAGESVMVTAQRLLSEFGNLKTLAGASLEELSQVRGIGLAKASQIKAAFELAGRLERYAEDEKRPLLKTPENVAELLKSSFRGKTREHFMVVLLDTRSRLIKVSQISIGSLDSSIVHPREAFKEAISASAVSVILAHNHPSGDDSPSEDDIILTKRLADAGELMGIEVLDHIIITDNSYLSLKRADLF